MGTQGPDDPDDPDDLADAGDGRGSTGGEPATRDDGDGGDVHPLDALEQGQVDPRLLRPDPGETPQQFRDRLLATVLGLDAEGFRGEAGGEVEPEPERPGSDEPDG